MNCEAEPVTDSRSPDETPLSPSSSNALFAQVRAIEEQVIALQKAIEENTQHQPKAGLTTDYPDFFEVPLGLDSLKTLGQSLL